MRLRLTLLVGVSVLAQSPNPAKNAPGIEFVKIAPGEFLMGCSAGDNDCINDEKPAHKVQITKAFEIGKFEVTQAQWQAVMGSNPSSNKADDHPVEMLSKDEAHQFLAKLNERNDGYKYRLPTEAEWEYAARAGSAQTPPLNDVAWYQENSGDETHPVGTKKPNAWGLYDMLGNVREWVEDIYNGNYYSNSPAADPTGPQLGQGGGGGRGGAKGPGGAKGGLMRQLPVIRGGSFDNPASFVRFSSRYHYYGPTLRGSDIGFRAVREPMQ